MPKFRKRTTFVEATQWFKNGDHPEDFSAEKIGYENGELRTWTGAEVKANGWEGQIVRYFRHPHIDGQSICPHCNTTMHVHGWMETERALTPNSTPKSVYDGGFVVCPGDYVITAENGERYRCSEHDFYKTYEPVTE